MNHNNHGNDFEHANGAHAPWGKRWAMLKGLLIGGAAGSTAMLLLAPRSGKRTRIKLQRAGNELVEQTSDGVHDAVSNARDRTQQLTHELREKAEKLEKRGHAMADGIKRS